MSNDPYLNSQNPPKPPQAGYFEHRSLFEGNLDKDSGSQDSQTLCAPFFQIENKLLLMYRSIAAERNRDNDITIVNEVGKQEIRIAFPAIVFYTVMEELIENAFRFSLGKSQVTITFSEGEGRLQVAIITQGSFSREPAETSDFSESPVHAKLSIGLALTNKLCKYYNSHFAIYQNLDNLIITLEIPINFE